MARKKPEPTFIVKIQPNESIYGLSGNPIKADLTSEYAEAGVMEGLDIFKVIASTDEFDFNQIKPQASLELPILNARSAPQNRGMWDEYEEEEMDFIEADWATKNVFIQTVKPLPLQPFGYNQPASFLGEASSNSSAFPGFGFGWIEQCQPSEQKFGQICLSTKTREYGI